MITVGLIQVKVMHFHSDRSNIKVIHDPVLERLASISVIGMWIAHSSYRLKFCSQYHDMFV